MCTIKWMMLITTDGDTGGCTGNGSAGKTAVPIPDRAARDSATPEVQPSTVTTPPSPQELPTQPPVQGSSSQPSSGVDAQGGGVEHKVADKENGMVSQVEKNDIIDGPVVPDQSPKRYVIMLKSYLYCLLYEGWKG